MFLDHNTISFKQLVPRKFQVYKASRLKNHPVNGLDTETYHGYARIITDSSGNCIDVDGIDSVLAFLTSKRFRNHHNFFYNIRFDFQAIVKYLPKEDLGTLYTTGKVEYKKYKISYIPRKMVSIVHSNHTYKFYDLFPFFLKGLGKTAKKLLGAKKNEGGIDAAKLNVDDKYWKDNYDEIVKYCVSDSKLTQRLGVLLQETYKKALGFPPQRYVSQANISKEYFGRVCDIPDIRGIDRKIKKYAFNCYHGGRFEILKKGWFDEVTLIDINSAYPYYIANLVQCTEGVWKKVKEVEYDALHGYYLCKVDVGADMLPPFMVNVGTTLKIFPRGEFGVYLTKYEVESYGEYCDIKVLRGYELRGNNRTKPFEDAIYKLYELKKATDKKDFRYDIYKKTANAFYGTFYEKIKKGEQWVEGKLFNPLLAAEITANTRVQVYQEAMKYGERVIGFATDSVIVEGKVEMDNHKRLGEFDVDKVGGGCVLQSGIYEIAGEHKTRGMLKGTNLEKGGMEYENIFDYIKKEPKRMVYEWDIKRPVNLGEAVKHYKKWSKEDINVWNTFHKSLDINKDKKRLWDGVFKDGGELYEKHIESKPLDVKLAEEAQKRRTARLMAKFVREE